MASVPYPVCIHQTTANRWNGIKQSRPLHICSEMVQNNGSVIWLFSGFGTPPTSKRCFGSGDMLHRASSSKSSAFIQWIPFFFPVGYSQLSSEVASCSQLQINPSMEPQTCTTEKHRGQAWGPWCFSECTYSTFPFQRQMEKKKHFFVNMLNLLTERPWIFCRVKPVHHVGVKAVWKWMHVNCAFVLTRTTCT